MGLFKNFRNFNQNSINKAVDWFKDKIKSLDMLTLKMRVGHKNYSDPLKGFMMFFQYDAKYKLQLPYYDKFPLVLPFNVQSDRFWGLNLHYLPYEYRIRLLDALSELVVDSSIPDQKKFAIGWQILRQSAQINIIKPCVKQYLISPKHLKSSFLMVDSEEWLNAILLPNEQFVKKDPKVSDDIERFIKVNKETVWQDSTRRR